MIGVSYILAIILAPIVVKKVGLGRPNVEGQGMGTHDRAHFERPDVEGPVEEDDDF